MIDKKEALELTKQLWKWLALNPEKGKEDWPEWRKHYHGWNYCPLCNYSIRQAGRAPGLRRTFRSEHCTHCPLRNTWTTDITIPTSKPPCEATGSPYAVWLSSPKSLKIRTAAAWEVSHLCSSALTTILKEEVHEEIQTWHKDEEKACRHCGQEIKKKVPVHPPCPVCLHPLNYIGRSNRGSWFKYKCPNCFRLILAQEDGKGKDE